MSTMLSLFCYVLGDGPNTVFSVNIDSSETIGNLKDVIKVEKSNAFKNVDAPALRLWKVSIAADDIFKNGIDFKDFDDARSLPPMYDLSQVFSEPPLENHVHIVVRLPEDFHGDDFCRRVFDRLWSEREHQTCIRERDGFKYLDLRKLELKFGKCTQLLIRQEYIRLASKVEEVYGIYLKNKSSSLPPGGIVITGQPGIGKTLFLHWLLLERLLDGKPTILRMKKDYAYFSFNGFIRISEFALPPHPDTWLLVDAPFGGDGPPMQTGLFTIVTTSPPEATYKAWRKYNLARLVIMNTWTWEELSFVGSSFYDKGSIDLEKLETAFNLYGPMAHNSLEYACNKTTREDLESAVDVAIGGVESNQLSHLAGQQGAPDVSSGILCMFGNDKEIPLFTIISPHVGVKVYETLQSRERIRLAIWFQQFSNVPEPITPAGWIWEGYCHKTLPTRSFLEITSLDDKKMEILSLVPSSRVDVKALTDISKKPSHGYYAPVARGNKTFDAFSVTHNNQVVLMQFTVSSEQFQSETEKLDALANMLSKDFEPFKGYSWLFIWVVPKGKECYVTEQLATAGHWKAWQKQGTMKQYVATFEL